MASKVPNPPSPAATILSPEERLEAHTLGAYRYIQSRRYRTLRDTSIAEALEAMVQKMQEMKYPNPYDGRVLGALARELIRADAKAVGYLWKNGVAALKDEEKREKLFTYIGMLAAEKFLEGHRKEIPKEPRLSNAALLLESAGEMFEDMRARGLEMAEVDVIADEIAIKSLDDEEAADPSDIAVALLDEAVLAYDNIAPVTDEDDDVPPLVQREAISKAAFMQLAADDLSALATREGFEELPNKDAMATELARKYRDDLDKVADLVVHRQHGDPEYGLVTRLLPLNEVPDLDALASTIESFQGRYFEVRTANFFIFGPATRTASGLSITGKVRTFTVNPAEAAGKAHLNPKPHTQQVTIKLRNGERWAAIEATRRTSDLGLVRAVLRRTGEVQPSAELWKPTKLDKEPFDLWDPRTLWMLDFIRRDLQAVELSLDDMLMAHFVTPDSKAEVEADDRTPNVEAVRLFGRQLQDHPEACARIADAAQLRDIEVRLRNVYDLGQGYSKLIRFRISWERDHLAVLSGADNDGKYDQALHDTVVGLVRTAGRREIDGDGLELTLRRIERIAAGNEDGDEHVFQAATG